MEACVKQALCRGIRGQISLPTLRYHTSSALQVDQVQIFAPKCDCTSQNARVIVRQYLIVNNLLLRVLPAVRRRVDPGLYSRTRPDPLNPSLEVRQIIRLNADKGVVARPDYP